VTIIWTDEEIEKYGAELLVHQQLGVRWCTMLTRFRQVFPSIDEAELRRLLCLYQAKLSSHDTTKKEV